MENLFEKTGLFARVPSGARLMVCGADRAYKIYYALHLQTRGETVFFVCQNDYEAKKFYGEFLKYKDDSQVVYYPKAVSYTHLFSACVFF